MSHDPRYVSSAPRPAATGAADSTRPRAGFYRARMVEIKRRGPSARVSSLAEEQQSMMDYPHFGASPAVKGEENSRMSPSPQRAGVLAPSVGEHHNDVPPPPPPHSPSQRSVSIARGSYMDYESNSPASRSPHFSQPFRQSPPPPPVHQHQEAHRSRASPTAAIRVARATRNFRYEAEEEAIPHQSAPPPPLHHEQEEYDPRRLLPTAVRPPQAFQFELEEGPSQLSSSELDIPGRFPASSSPNAVDTNEYTTDSQMGGVQEDIPTLRPVPGSYRELQPYELGLIYSNPGPYQTLAPSTDYAQHNVSNPAEPFLFEVRSPRKGNHDGSNKPLRRAAYDAQNPAHEAEAFPLLRRLGEHERCATSFRAKHGEVADHSQAEQADFRERAGNVEHVEGGQRTSAHSLDGYGMPMDGVETTGGVDVRVLEIERRRAERRGRR